MAARPWSSSPATYHLPGTQTDKKLKAGDVSKTSAYKIQKVTNLTVLSAMKKRGLIPATGGYSIVMIGQNHTADGVQFFATSSGKPPVKIPSDILNLTVDDGPRSGVAVVDKKKRLKTLASETRNHARLSVGSFSGSGIMVQSWTSKPVVKNGVTEVVELMESKGRINGMISGNSTSVGVIDLSLTKSKTVDLKRYGVNTSTTGSYTSGVGIVVAPPSSLSPPPDITNVSSSISTSTGASATLLKSGSATLQFNGGSLGLNDTGITLSPGAALWVNPAASSTDIGLTLAFDGTVIPLLGLANELTITTVEGPVVFTRENGDIWTPVTPEPAASP
jgi:hypothetical protein